MCHAHRVSPEWEARARVPAVSLCAALADDADVPVHGGLPLLAEAPAGVEPATS